MQTILLTGLLVGFIVLVPAKMLMEKVEEVRALIMARGKRKSWLEVASAMDKIVGGFAISTSPAGTQLRGGVIDAGFSSDGEEFYILIDDSSRTGRKGVRWFNIGRPGWPEYDLKDVGNKIGISIYGEFDGLTTIIFKEKVEDFLHRDS